MGLGEIDAVGECELPANFRVIPPIEIMGYRPTPSREVIVATTQSLSSLADDVDFTDPNNHPDECADRLDVPRPEFLIGQRPA